MKRKLLKAILTFSIIATVALTDSSVFHANEMSSAETQATEEFEVEENFEEEKPEKNEEESLNRIKDIILILICVTSIGIVVTMVLIRLSKKAEEKRVKEFIKKENEKLRLKKEREEEELNSIITSYDNEYDDDQTIKVRRRKPKVEQTENLSQISEKTINAVNEDRPINTPDMELEETTAPQMQPQSQAPVAPEYSQPVYQGSPMQTYQQPVYQQPVQPQPIYQQPVQAQPMYQQPVYQQPMYQQPTYSQPIQPQPMPQQSQTPQSQPPKKKIPAYARKNKNITNE